MNFHQPRHTPLTASEMARRAAVLAAANQPVQTNQPAALVKQKCDAESPMVVEDGKLSPNDEKQYGAMTAQILRDTRRAIALASDDARLAVFQQAAATLAEAVAGQWLPKVVMVDRLYDIATAHKFFGRDQYDIQGMIGEYSANIPAPISSVVLPPLSSEKLARRLISPCLSGGSTAVIRAALEQNLVLDTGLFVDLRDHRHGRQDFSDGQARPPAFVPLDQENSVSRDVVSGDMPPRLKIEARRGRPMFGMRMPLANTRLRLRAIAPVFEREFLMAAITAIKERGRAPVTGHRPRTTRDLYVRSSVGSDQDPAGLAVVFRSLRKCGNYLNNLVGDSHQPQTGAKDHDGRRRHAGHASEGVRFMSLTRKLRFGSRTRVLNLCPGLPLFQESTSSRASAAAVADVETGKGA
jgi:hypothetical protein